MQTDDLRDLDTHATNAQSSRRPSVEYEAPEEDTDLHTFHGRTARDLKKPGLNHRQEIFRKRAVFNASVTFWIFQYSVVCAEGYN